MLIPTTKNIDVEKIINELTMKVNKRGVEGKSYMVEVNKQLLADARDIISFYNSKYGSEEVAAENDNK